VGKKKMKTLLAIFGVVLMVMSESIGQDDTGDLSTEYSKLIAKIEKAKRNIPYLCGWDRNRMITKIHQVEEMKNDDHSALNQEDLELTTEYQLYLDRIDTQWRTISVLASRAILIRDQLSLEAPNKSEMVR